MRRGVLHACGEGKDRQGGHRKKKEVGWSRVGDDVDSVFFGLRTTNTRARQIGEVFRSPQPAPFFVVVLQTHSNTHLSLFVIFRVQPTARTLAVPCGYGASSQEPLKSS